MTEKQHFSLISTCTTGKPGRYSANGIRISKERYEHIVQQASMYGSLDCFSTRAWPTYEGGTKRKNYSTASF